MMLNLAAYSTEIIRAGVDAIHKSQIEAGVSLALTRLQVFRHVVLMPALAKVWPALSSQYVLMLLASSIVSFISVEELSGAAAIIEQNTFRSFETYIVATLIYLALALGLKALLFAVGRRAFPRGTGTMRRSDARPARRAEGAGMIESFGFNEFMFLVRSAGWTLLADRHRALLRRHRSAASSRSCGCRTSRRCAGSRRPSSPSSSRSRC